MNTKSIKQLRSNRPARGITLIEVLISIFIMSFGLLGIAALQTTVAQSQSGSAARANASVVSADISDRVRSNPLIMSNQVIFEAYKLNTSTYTAQAAAAAAITAPPTTCRTAVCTATAQVTYDLAQSSYVAGTTLPGGALMVTPNWTERSFTTTVLWFDKDWLDKDKALLSSSTCAAAEPDIAKQRFCCPAGASAGPGVRCVRTVVSP